MSAIEQRAQDLFSQVVFRDWQFHVKEDRFRVTFFARDQVTGNVELQTGRPWLLWPEMSDSQIVLTAWAAIEMALIHEAREEFRYRRRRVFGPHVSVDAMWQVANKLDLGGEVGSSSDAT